MKRRGRNHNKRKAFDLSKATTVLSNLIPVDLTSFSQHTALLLKKKTHVPKTRYNMRNLLRLGCCVVAWTHLQVVGASSMDLNPFQTGDNFVLDSQHPAIKFEMNTNYAVPDSKGHIKRFTSGNYKWHYTWKKSWSYSWTTTTFANGTTVTNVSNTTTNTEFTNDTDFSSLAGSNSGGSNGDAVVGVVQPPQETGAATANNKTRRLEDSSTDLDRLRGAFGNVVVNMNRLPLRAAAPTSPWPSSYWPSYLDGINNRWNRNQPSPSEKYAQAFGLNVQQFTDAVSRKSGILSADSRQSCAAGCSQGSQCVRRGNSQGLCVPMWFGICHAWSVAAVMEPEPRCAVTVNNVRFEPKDIKGLISQFYDDSGVSTVFIGARYNGNNDAVDRYGRFTDPAHRDVGPGMFHIAMANIIGLQRRAFIIDADAGAQVWNQPVRGYQVVEQRTMTPAQAARQYFRVNAYPFNNAARSIQYIRNRFSYIVETEDNDPKVSTGKIDASTKSVDYTYLLELDANGNIIGGEWVGESRQTHPDFLWFPTSRPSTNAVSGVGLSYARVRDLVQRAQTC